MKRGGKFLVSTTVLAVAACGGEQGDLKVRSIPTPLAQGVKPVPFRIAEARGQLALGNVALALESYRKALRDEPNSTDALAGIATCYDRMGRFDLSRRNYEAALALAPADVELLGAFAQSLHLQGKLMEAQRVRAEIAQRLGSSPAPQTPELATRTPMPGPAPQIATFAAEPARAEASLPMALPASAPVVVQEAPTEIAIPRPVLAAGPVQVAGTATPARMDVAVPNMPDARLAAEIPAPPETIAPRPVEQVAIGSSVTVKLPPPRRMEAPVLQAAAPAPAAPIAVASVDLPPLKPYARPVPKPAVAEHEGPRLERLSLGEIGLITAPGPMWQTTVVARSERSTTVRWVSLRDASTQSARVRLLNAARVNRLAARTRSWLVAHGWSSMAIGDAPAARSRSVILYPVGERALAQTLANQFGFVIEERSDAKFVTMLLGRDAARIDELRPQRA